MEKGIPIAEAAKLLNVPLENVRRWIVRGSDGTLLRAWKLGRKWYTSEQAIQEFIAGCTPQIELPAQKKARAAAEREEERRWKAWVAEARRRHNV